MQHQKCNLYVISQINKLTNEVLDAGVVVSIAFKMHIWNYKQDALSLKGATGSSRGFDMHVSEITKVETEAEPSHQRPQPETN